MVLRGDSTVTTGGGGKCGPAIPAAFARSASASVGSACAMKGDVTPSVVESDAASPSSEGKASSRGRMETMKTPVRSTAMPRTMRKRETDEMFEIWLKYTRPGGMRMMQ